MTRHCGFTRIWWTMGSQTPLTLYHRWHWLTITSEVYYCTLQSSLQIQHSALLDDGTSHAHYLTPDCTWREGFFQNYLLSICRLFIVTECKFTITVTQSALLQLLKGITGKPVYNGHSRDWRYLCVIDRCPLKPGYHYCAPQVRFEYVKVYLRRTCNLNHYTLYVHFYVIFSFNQYPCVI